jgi:hypothetical protein
MAREALIKFRCESALKARIEALASNRDQSASDFIRQHLLVIIEEEEDRIRRRNLALAAEDPASYPAPKSGAAFTPRQVHALRGSRSAPSVPKPRATG